MNEAVEDSEPKDTRFNPSRLPISENAKALVSEVRGQLLNYEAKLHPRKRQRKLADQERFDRIVSALVCDLAHSALTDPGAWRHISLSKRESAQNVAGASFMTEARINIIRWMSSLEMDWLELHKAAQVRNPFGGQQSTIRASARLRRYMDDHEIRFEDLGRDPESLGDPIILRDKKTKGRRAKNLRVPEGEPAESFRAAVLRLNRWLASAHIVCDYPDENGRDRDAGERWLRRIFNDDCMGLGGRLYGGFWQSMAKDARLEGISINDEPVASLDFGQCAINIAYAEVDVTPPAGDLYVVPGLEDCREGVKALLNAQFHRPNELTKLPRGTRKLFPKRLKVQDVIAPILRHHAAIGKLFHAGFGMRGFFIESEILMKSLLTLMDRGIVALPIHDCLVVPLPDAPVARDVMQASFREITGAMADVEIDGVCAPMPSGHPWPHMAAMPWVRLLAVE